MAIPTASSAPIGSTFSHSNRQYIVTGHRDQTLYPGKIIANAVNSNTVLLSSAISAASDAVSAKDEAITAKDLSESARDAAALSEINASSSAATSTNQAALATAAKDHIESQEVVVSDEIDTIVGLSPTDFNNIATHDPRTLYVQVPEE